LKKLKYIKFFRKKRRILAYFGEYYYCSYKKGFKIALLLHSLNLIGGNLNEQS